MFNFNWNCKSHNCDIDACLNSDRSLKKKYLLQLCKTDFTWNNRPKDHVAILDLSQAFYTVLMCFDWKHWQKWKAIKMSWCNVVYFNFQLSIYVKKLFYDWPKLLLKYEIALWGYYMNVYQGVIWLSYIISMVFPTQCSYACLYNLIRVWNISYKFSTS